MIFKFKKSNKELKKIAKDYEENNDLKINKYLCTLTRPELDLICVTEDTIEAMWNLPVVNSDLFKNLLVSNLLLRVNLTNSNKYDSLSKLDYKLDENQIKLVKYKLLDVNIHQIFNIKNLDLIKDIRIIIFTNYLFLINPLFQILNFV
jgi:hypothetical protein